MLPIAILLPHAGLAIPDELAGRHDLGETHLFNEADIYSDLLFDFRGKVRRWLRFPYARALIDVNRPDDPRRVRPGDGIVKHRTSYGRPVYHRDAAPGTGEEGALRERYWRPWHQQLAAIAADESIKLVLDCHSMAAVGPHSYDDPGARRPRATVCNLGDAAGECEPSRGRLSAPPSLARNLATHLATALHDLPCFADTGPAVQINHPFWGGWDVWAHARRGQPWLMIEINRALYLGGQDGDSAPLPPNDAAIALLRQRVWSAIEALFATL